MKPTTVDEYIQGFSGTARDRLVQIRQIIKTIAPEADESISYGIIGYKINKKPLVYFGAYENHIGIYALPTTHSAFKDELSGYKQGKGSVQFPLNKPLPEDLIKKVLNFRLNALK